LTVNGVRPRLSITPAVSALEIEWSPDNAASCSSTGGFRGDGWDNSGTGTNRAKGGGTHEVLASDYPTTLPAIATYTITCRGGNGTTATASVEVTINDDQGGDNKGTLTPVPGREIIRITNQITGQPAHSTVGQVKAVGGSVENVSIGSIVRASNPSQTLEGILTGHPAPACRFWLEGDSRPAVATSGCNNSVPHLSANQIVNIEVEIPGGSKLRRVTENSPYKVEVGNDTQTTNIIFEYRVPNIQEF
jgi:hypothetical protein